MEFDFGCDLDLEYEGHHPCQCGFVYPSDDDDLSTISSSFPLNES